MCRVVKPHYSILNRLDVIHKCDVRTDGQTDGIVIATAASNTLDARQKYRPHQNPTVEKRYVTSSRAQIDPQEPCCLSR